MQFFGYFRIFDIVRPERDYLPLRRRQEATRRYPCWSGWDPAETKEEEENPEEKE